jgi:hypothetical protein
MFGMHAFGMSNPSIMPVLRVYQTSMMLVFGMTHLGIVAMLGVYQTGMMLMLGMAYQGLMLMRCVKFPTVCNSRFMPWSILGVCGCRQRERTGHYQKSQLHYWHPHERNAR